MVHSIRVTMEHNRIRLPEQVKAAGERRENKTVQKRENHQIHTQRSQ